jgi:hypothetical protein
MPDFIAYASRTIVLASGGYPSLYGGILVNSAYAFIRSVIRSALFEVVFFCTVVAVFLAFYSRKVDQLIAMAFLGVLLLGSIVLMFRSRFSNNEPSAAGSKSIITRRWGGG